MPQDAELLFSASRFRVLRVSAQLEPGRTCRREIIRHPGAVAILPLVDEQTICLIRNFRLAVEQTLIELPAGALDPGEDPLQAARRELMEETGFRAGRLEPLLEFFVSPGILDERIHLFVATGLTPGAAARQPDEKIENLLVSWPEALEMVRDGRIRDAKTIVGLLYCDRLWGAASGGG